MRFCAISDLHGLLPEPKTIKQCDVLLIAGDIVDLYVQTSRQLSKEWFVESFLPWCDKVDAKDVLFVGGNHDFWIDRYPDEVRELCKGTKVTYLLDEACKLNEEDTTITVYGSPWCHQFGHWAFMGKTDSELEDIFDKMPDDVDILLTHDAPYGCSDVLLQKDCKWADGSHIGNKGLTNSILKKKPKMCLHGHLHSTNHDKEMLGYTEVYNVSLLDENYRLVYEPFYFEL